MAFPDVNGVNLGGACGEVNGRRSLQAFSVSDYVALAFFGLAWFTYWAGVERSSAARRSLNLLMNGHRHLWMEQMVGRDNRIVDTTIMASLQNGTAFFASTSLIAIGGVLALLQSTDTMLTLFGDLPFGLATTRLAWEVKVIGLAVIFVYAFFKFSWAYRLFNYGAILIGAVPILHGGEDKERARGRSARGGDEHRRRPPLQPRAARLLLRTRLPRLVRQRLRLHGRDGRGALRDVEAPVRLRRARGASGRGMMPTEEEIEATLLELLRQRGPGKTIGPTDVARALGGDHPDGWGPLMQPVRRTAVRLMRRAGW